MTKYYKKQRKDEYMKITADGMEISIINSQSIQEDFISLTDLARKKILMNQKMWSKIGYVFALL